MKIEIRQMLHEDEEAYERLLQDSTFSVFNHSLQYRNFLQVLLKGCRDFYLCAFVDNVLIAVIPTFVKSGPYGSVVNSLPFYGSHGGVIHRGDITQRVIGPLLDSLNKFCKEVDAISCTLIEPPQETFKEIYAQFDANLFDERIGQISLLPAVGKDISVFDSLLSCYHQKTRNMVRKGLKLDFEVSHDGSLETFKKLHQIHETNINAIGGKPKPWAVFETIHSVFRYDTDYRVYTAKKNGQIVSALLLFYFKDTVEYFTPATLEQYRSEQPLSVLIFKAMQDAIVEKGAKRWNWGGTWKSQSGVYRFKSRWGAKDHSYRYHVKTNHNRQASHAISSSVLLKEYEWFYVWPFSN